MRSDGRDGKNKQGLCLEGSSRLSGAVPKNNRVRVESKTTALKDKRSLPNIARSSALSSSVVSVSPRSKKTKSILPSIFSTDKLLHAFWTAIINKDSKTFDALVSSFEKNKELFNKTINADFDLHYEGESPLTLAVHFQNHHAVNVLLIMCVDTEHVNKNHETALIIAARRNDLKCAGLLLNHNADTDVTDNNGDSPLMIAIHQYCSNMVTVLLQHFPYLGTKNKQGLKAHTLAYKMYREADSIFKINQIKIIVDGLTTSRWMGKNPWSIPLFSIFAVNIVTAKERADKVSEHRSHKVNSTSYLQSVYVKRC